MDAAVRHMHKILLCDVNQFSQALPGEGVVSRFMRLSFRQWTDDQQSLANNRRRKIVVVVAVVVVLVVAVVVVVVAVVVALMVVATVIVIRLEFD